ncbi:pentatricopeptide repeat (PPR) superfamily protein [Wolffia australiana]
MLIAPAISRSRLSILAGSQFAGGIDPPTSEDVARSILQQKSASSAVQIFEQASQFAKFRHDAATYGALVRALVSFRRFDKAKSVLSEIPAATGRPPDEDTLVAFVRGLGRAGMTRDAVQVADLANPSVKVFNSILNVLVVENIDLARKFYRDRMTGSPVRGNAHTFGIMMKGLCRTNRIDEGFKLLKLFKSSELPQNPVIYNTLIHALCRNGKLGRARSLMSVMNCANDVTFNIMISAYCAEKNYLQGMVMLEKCFDLGFVPDVVAVTKLVNTLCKECRFKEAMEIMIRVEKRGGVVDVVSYNTLIEGFCEAGKPGLGLRLVKEMEAKGCLPNLRTYNSLIFGFCAAGNACAAVDLFERIKEDQIEPDFKTYDAIIRGFCSVGRVEDGYKFLEMMEEQREELWKRIGPYNSILYGLYREERFDEAQEFLEKMGEFFPRSVECHANIFSLCQRELLDEAMKTYEQFLGEGGSLIILTLVRLIDALCLAKRTREAFSLMNEMIRMGYLPAVKTFNSFICGFCKEGKPVSAMNMLREMASRGCLPDPASYNLLIEVFCGEDDLRIALHLLEEMVGQGLIPEKTVWEHLINSLGRSRPWVDDQDSSCRMMDEVLCKS